MLVDAAERGDRRVLHADGVWTKGNICSRIPKLVGPRLCAARLLYGDETVSSETSFPCSALKAVQAFN